ncbi:hypothetical protein FCV25MIE_27680 [Fagus crenata]
MGISQGVVQSKEAKRIDLKNTRPLNIDSGERRSYVMAVGGMKHETTVKAKPPLEASKIRKENTTGNQGNQDPL